MYAFGVLASSMCQNTVNCKNSYSKMIFGHKSLFSISLFFYGTNFGNVCG